MKEELLRRGPLFDRRSSRGVHFQPALRGSLSTGLDTRASTPPTRTSHGSRAQRSNANAAPIVKREIPRMLCGENQRGENHLLVRTPIPWNLPYCLHRTGLAARTFVSPKAVVADDAVPGIAARARAPRRL